MGFYIQHYETQQSGLHYNLPHSVMLVSHFIVMLSVFILHVVMLNKAIHLE